MESGKSPVEGLFPAVLEKAVTGVERAVLIVPIFGSCSQGLKNPLNFHDDTVDGYWCVCG